MCISIHYCNAKISYRFIEMNGCHQMFAGEEHQSKPQAMKKTPRHMLPLC